MWRLEHAPHANSPRIFIGLQAASLNRLSLGVCPTFGNERGSFGLDSGFAETSVLQPKDFRSATSVSKWFRPNRRGRGSAIVAGQAILDANERG